MRLTIYRKMMIGFSLVIGLMIIVNLYVLAQLYSVSSIAQETVTSDIRIIDLARTGRSYITDQERYAQKYGITLDSTYIGLLLDRTTQVDAMLDSILRITSDSQQRSLLLAAQLSHERLAESFDRARTRKAARGDTGAWVDTLHGLYDRLDEVVRRNQVLVGASMAQVDAKLARSANVVLILNIVAVLVAIFAALIITRTITRPIRVLQRGTAQIARGVFTPVTVTSRDEIAHLAAAVNDMAGKLKKANEAKAEIMHIISHELRTPLQTAISAQHLLEEERVGPLNEEQHRLLTMIRHSNEMLTSFSRQFLDLEKMEAGKMEYRFERLDIFPLLSRIVDEAGVDATRKEIHLTLTGLTHAEVMAEPARLMTAFANLLGNAIKYTPRRGSVEVSVKETAGMYRISFTDTGIGVAPADIPKLFTKFYRASNASAESTRGTGIGLALVKAIVEAHKGKTWVESELGKGSTFVVELPRASTA